MRIGNRTIGWMGAAAAICAWAATSTPAHETWLIPDPFRGSEGQVVQLKLLTGQRFPQSDVTLEPGRIATFEARRGETAKAIQSFGVDELAVTANVTLPRAGAFAVGVALHPSIADLDVSVFEQYLRDERADKALALLAEGRPVAGAVVAERYTKYMKTIVQIGRAAADEDGYKTPLGHRLEVMPLSNPADWVAGADIAVQVLLDGYPWPDVSLSLGMENSSGSGSAAQMKSDADGMAKLKLPDAGKGYIKAYLIRRTNGLERCDWESFWATFTFEVGGRTGIMDTLEWIRRIHGRPDPMAVAGYRMGTAALSKLEIRSGSDDLTVTYHCPAEKLYAAAVDGIQAATGATLGKMNLELRSSGIEEMRAVFTRRSKSQAVIVRLTPRFLAQMRSMKAGEKEALSTATAAMADDDIFSLSIVPPLPNPSPTPRR